MLWYSVVLLALFASVQGRAINISNTWVLPEEGFPVFYRYFRDRISWYEADAVCQFHHANLVTVDTTAQYDAVRAYLKELDISSAVWVGLIRSNPEGDFTWTDYRGLSGEGYWSSAPDARAAPLCAAADPAADYRWEARNCGGPTVAAFICELPVPQWALGNEGCMVRALPALTVLYLPESAAVQLTADCGLAGVKRVQCTGNVKRENLLRDLSCSEEEETTSIASVTLTSVSWPMTSDATFTDSDNTDGVTEETITTNHDVANYTEIPASKPIIYDIKEEILQNNNQLNSKSRILDKSNYLDNNLQSNDIPQVAINEQNSLTNEQSEKLEDEKLMQHKMIHEELARLGNFETIFTQPTDHFVPPLVMAKAKLSDDMTVLSLQEKHAQQIAEEHYMKRILEEQNDQLHEVNYATTTENNSKIYTTSSARPSTGIDIVDVKDEKKEIKVGLPKKYNEKLNDPKNKPLKMRDNKVTKNEKSTESYLTSTQITEKEITSTTSKITSEDNYNKTDEDPTIDLTVIIKEPGINGGEKIFYSNTSGDISGINVGQSDYLVSQPDTERTSTESSEKAIKPQSTTETQNKAEFNYTTLNHQVIKITIINDDTDTTPTTMEISTKFPIFEDTSSTHSPIEDTTKKFPTTNINKFTSDNSVTQTMKEELTTMTTKTAPITTEIINSNTEIFTNIKTTKSSSLVSTAASTETSFNTTDSVNENSTLIFNTNITETVASTVLANGTNENIEAHNITETHDGDHVEYITNTEEMTDNFQSSLLSGANEPVHRPPRSRRPQYQPNRIKKFNPFRILG